MRVSPRRQNAEKFGKRRKTRNFRYHNIISLLGAGFYLNIYLPKY